MKTNIFIMAVLFFSVIACKNKPDSQAVTEEEMEQPELSVSNMECFTLLSGKDTVMLSIMTVNGENVSGNLKYSWFEKDVNEGTLAGTFNGDTLFVDYTFSSEGRASVREAVFLKKENKLIQGIGAMDEKGNRQVFRNKNNIEFNESIVLTKTDCNQQ